MTCKHCNDTGKYVRNLTGETREVDCMYCTPDPDGPRLDRRRENLGQFARVPPEQYDQRRPALNQSGQPFMPLPVVPPRVKP